jgi:glutamyl/glutaminyl-tRNA synthetase
VTVRTRFAPTPSGFMHIGNAVNALLVQRLARSVAGGWLLLRIDDADATKRVPGVVEDILDTMQWLGIAFDAGPTTVSDFNLKWSQQHRRNPAEKALQWMRDHDLVYACRCSRADVRRVSPTGVYPGTCRNQRISLDEPNVAWRWRLPEDSSVTINDQWRGSCTVDLHRTLNDPTVRLRNGTAAYNLVSITDDILFGITHVVRGSDLLVATACQMMLSSSVPMLEPFSAIRMFHHDLVLGPNNIKLSKSQGATELRALRAAGLTVEAVEKAAADVMYRTLAHQS